MTVQLDSAVVRLRDQHGQVVGAGFLAGEREVLTCAHVVTRALGLPEDAPPPPDAEVRLDFPLIARNQIVTAKVAVWHPPAADGEGDVAGLELSDDPPAGARPARLLMADELWRHEFRTFGFPAGYDDGVWASGRLLARQAMQWVQMEDVKQTGYRVEPGFSGAPVWDDELDGVVGITVAAERRAEVRAAYLIPAGVLVETWPALATRAIPPCPYRGLSAFREQDASVFFGREELTDQLAEAVGQNSLVAVIGSSGSGKSSLVFAGLMPRLHQRSEWAVASLRPATGLPPLTVLAAALLLLLEPEMSEAARLLELPALTTVLRDGRLVEVVDRVLSKANARRLLLVIDQFEELFALEPAERQRFVDVLLEAIAAQRQRAESALTATLTLRADFLGQALAHSGLAEVLQGASLMLGPMTREQLRRAIEGPAAHQVTYEPGLVDRILADVGENPGNLPLLEFALTLLWEGQANGKLTHAAYGVLGGVDGALARYAEEVYLRLPEPDREGARRLFVQLVRPGEGTEHTRRVAFRADLGEREWQLAQRLAGTRLVVTSRDLAGAETVELAHEALLPGWRRLREWIEADHAFRAWQEQLRSAIQQWEASGRDDGGLLRGGPLAEAERWLEQRPGETGRAEQAFVAGSRALQDRELQVVRRRNRQLRMLAVALSLLLVVALLSAGLAQRQTRQAQAQTRIATSRQLAAQAIADLDARPWRALLLSLQALRLADTGEARSSLVAGLQRDPRLAAFLPAPGPPHSIAFSQDGRTLAMGSFELPSGSFDKTVVLWDVQRRQRLGTLAGDEEVYSMALSPDGRTLATGTTDSIVLWDIQQQKSLGQPLTSTSGVIDTMTFSPDGQTLATGGHSLRIWDVQRRQLLLEFSVGRDAPVLGVAFSPDGRTLAIGSHDKTVILWDVQHRRRLKTLTGHQNPVSIVAFSPDGRTLATGSRTDLVLWDVQRPQPVGTRLTQPPHVLGVAFSPDGRTLATAGQEVILWDIRHRRRLQAPIAGGASGALSVAFSPDGRTLATGGYDKIVALWDIGRRQRMAESLVGHTDAVSSVAFSPDGRTLATGSQDKTVILWDVQHRQRLATLGHTDAASSLAFSPDGRTLASASNNEQTAILWDVQRRTRLVTLLGPYNAINSLAFNPDGRTLAAGSFDMAVHLWDVQQRSSLGIRLVGHTSAVSSVAFRPDGRILATASEDTTVILWDVRHRRRLSVLAGHGEPVLSVAFSPDGRTLASGGADKTLLWNVQNREIQGALTEPAMSLAFSPDGRTLAAANEKNAIVWDIELTSWRRQACDLIGPLTDTEPGTFLPGPQYRNVCR